LFLPPLGLQAWDIAVISLSWLTVEYYLSQKINKARLMVMFIQSLLVKTWDRNSNSHNFEPIGWSTELNERNRYWFWADHKWGCSQPGTVLLFAITNTVRLVRSYTW